MNCPKCNEDIMSMSVHYCNIKTTMNTPTPRTDAFFERNDRRAGHWIIEPLEVHARWLESLMVRLYNQGYHAGHEDTVEACFTPIHHTDMDIYHADVVAEILQENSQADRPNGSV